MTDLLKGVVNSVGGTGTRVRSYFTGTVRVRPEQQMITPTHGLSALLRNCCRRWVGFDDARIRFKKYGWSGRQGSSTNLRIVYAKTYEDPGIGLTQEYFVNRKYCYDTICADTKKKARAWCPNKTTESSMKNIPLDLCDKHTSADWNQGKEGKTPKRKVR